MLCLAWSWSLSVVAAVLAEGPGSALHATTVPQSHLQSQSSEREASLRLPPQSGAGVSRQPQAPPETTAGAPSPPEGVTAAPVRKTTRPGGVAPAIQHVSQQLSHQSAERRPPVSEQRPTKPKQSSAQRPTAPQQQQQSEPHGRNCTKEPLRQKKPSTHQQQSPSKRPPTRPFDNSGGLLSSLLRGLGGTIGRISQYNWGNLWSNQTANMIMRDDTIQSKCFGSLGCVNYTAVWYHSVHRPVNFFPLEPTLIDVKFWVHTRQLPQQNISLTAGQPSTVADTGFSTQRDTKFIIHGFLDTGTDDWVQEMAQRLLDAEDCNVVAVDWRFGALPMYNQALSNTQLVAMETTELIKWLQAEYGLDVGRVHLIGHSLGAQTAGYVGARVPGIARISGLDPAEPGFQYMDPEVRLDEGDAQFVDVIHSDARSFFTSGLGMVQACGHLDFYPNGGQEQPGCSSYSSTLDVLLKRGVDDFEAELFACRHVRALRFFTDSIARTPSCDFIGHECDGYDKFLKGECGECGADNQHCASMGYHADQYKYKHRVNVPLYLTTTERSPFCRESTQRADLMDFLVRHYRLTLSTSDHDGQQRKLTGHLTTSIFGANGKLENYRIPEEGYMDLVLGSESSLLVRAPVVLGPVQRLVLRWHHGGSSILPLPCLLWCPDSTLILRQATLLDMDQPGSDSSTVQLFCGSGSDGLVRLKPSGEPVTLYNRTKCAPIAVQGAAEHDRPAGLFPGLPNPLSVLSGRRRRLKYSYHSTDGAAPGTSAELDRREKHEPTSKSRWTWNLFKF